MELTINTDMESAIRSLKILVSLSTQAEFNRFRFDDCRKKVLGLDLPEIAKARSGQLFKKASRYIEFGEFGAFKFEMSLLIDLLRNQQASV